VQVRITRPRFGDVDGVSLNAYEVGRVYEVAEWLGAYLIATASAEAVSDDEIVDPLSEQRMSSFGERFRAVAADLGRARGKDPASDPQ
jgi:hypothetical protein